MINDTRSARHALALESREEQEALFSMADAMPHLVWIMNSDGSRAYYNNLWRDYASSPDAHLTNFEWTSVIHPNDLDRVRESWQRSFKAGKEYETEFRLLHRDTQTYRWFVSRSRPARDDKGRIVRWFGTCTDIDEQKRAAQIASFLAKATKELGSSLNLDKTLESVTKLSVPEIADWCSIDLYESGTDQWKQAALAHVDPTKEERVRQYRKLHPIRTDNPFGVPAVVRSGKAEFLPSISDEELEGNLKTSEEYKLAKELKIHAAIIAPIHIKGRSSGAITFVSSDSTRDYTLADLEMAEKLAGRISLSITNATVYKEAHDELERRHDLEKQLLSEKDKLEARVKARTKQLEDANIGLQAEIERRREAEKELTRSNQELQDFAYVASHDLQEPLRKIQAFGDILENEYSERLGDGAEYLKRMHAAAARMSKLIEDLLSFSRVTSRPPSPARVDLNDIIGEVLVDLEDQIARTKGRVDVGELPIVLADPTHMRQLFQNLISNALKFHFDDTKPVVSIKAKPCEDMNCPNFVITVADNGIGFDDKYIDRIFGVFQRLHGRDTFEGTGIGLAVCRKIVERYGGTITAVSQPGKGASFIIKIPTATKETKSDT